MKYDLIITIVNRGYADVVMDAARTAGARGGTIINARGTADQIEKLFSISVQPEKELVMIVAEHITKDTIMEEITKKAGLSSEGQGIIFSIPVEKAAGLR